MSKKKQFRDPVHGYIAVPDEFCSLLIDTPVFQRLREIEQTGIRVLFPGARHCRFSHSLGTYYLGTQAFARFKENAGNHFVDITPEKWDSYKKTFSIACLLHDCAHAPFSHIFENYYDFVKGAEPSRLLAPLLKAADDQNFTQNLQEPAANKPSPHEKASALVLLTYFKDSIRKLEGDPVLAARMILGCVHLGAQTDIHRLENCLISMLNNKAIDVDKLDYIARDTWASGVNNVSIDVQRLLSSMTYDPGEHRLAFMKSALSVIQSVVDGRNYLYRWLFSHHKVVYNCYLLQTAVAKLAHLISPDDSNEFLSSFFSVKAFTENIDCGGGINAYLPTDQDVMVLLKNYSSKIPEAEELLFRSHIRRPLWKTKLEFDRIFNHKTKESLIWIETNATELLADMVDGEAKKVGFVVQGIPEKFVRIDTGDVLILGIDDSSLSYNDLLQIPEDKSTRSGFYIYAPANCINDKQKFIDKLISLA